MSELLEKIGWVIVHTLWEGTLVGMVARLGCLFFRSFPASTRYSFLCCCLLICGLAPILTWFLIGNLDSEHLIPTFLRTDPPALTASAATKGFPESIFSYKAIPGPPINYIRLSWFLHQILEAAAVIWVAYASFLTFRNFLAYGGLTRLISSGIPASKARIAQVEYLDRLTALANRIGVQRTVLLVESAIIRAPATVGWFKPIILIPIGFATSLPLDQIEAVLAHELAHIRRADYVVNQLQIIVETLLFYHSSIRWISNAIREERENCCDDIAISVAGDKMTYLSALTTLAERSLPSSAMALGADGGSLFRRVSRILQTEQSDEIWGVVLVRRAYVGMLMGALVLSLCSAISFAKDHSSVTRHVDKVYLTEALVSAAAIGDISLMKAVIQEGADINANIRSAGQNALFASTKNNQTPAVELLLREGALVDAKNSSGMRPVDWALATGNFSMVQLLHDHGAHISPNAWAAITDDVTQLRLIVGQNSLTNGQKDELMKFAISMGHLDEVQFLEKTTGKPVAGPFLTDAATAGNLPMMAYILKQGASIRTDGANALEQAVLVYDQVEAARFLLQHGANPNQFTRWKRYLLSGVRSAGMVKVLLEGGANPNSEDEWGVPLAASPDAESVRLLVQFGAELHPVLGNGLSLIESAIMHDRQDKPDVLGELVKQGAAFDPKGNGVGALARAAAQNKVETMKCLLDMGVSSNSFLGSPYWRMSVMHSAVRNSAIEAVRLLLERGGAVKGDGQDGETPSSLALLSGDRDMANLLYEGGARDVGDLSIAAAFGDIKGVTDLIDEGADVNQTDSSGRTPLFFALKNGQIGIAHLLVQHGAVFNSEEINLSSR